MYTLFILFDKYVCVRYYSKSLWVYSQLIYDVNSTKNPYFTDEEEETQRW